MKIGMTPDPLRPDRLNTGDTRANGATGKDRTDGSARTPATGATAAPSLGALGASLGSADFNAGKVDEVRAAISEGRFKVDAHAVADGLLRSAADVAGRAI